MNEIKAYTNANYKGKVNLNRCISFNVYIQQFHI